MAEVQVAMNLSRSPFASYVHDVVIVDGGPAGLAAAVYAASEGLDAGSIAISFVHCWLME